MTRILEIDLVGQRVVVEPGVANLEVTRAVEAEGFFYAPDPSSQQVCTIGGNVAENSGGAHCLKHGFTVNHVTGLTVVLPDGEVVELGGKSAEQHGPDLLGVFVGSEGTLGIATTITLRIVRTPETVTTLLAGFSPPTRRALRCPASWRPGSSPAIEMMDRLTIEAAEAAVAPGYPEGRWRGCSWSSTESPCRLQRTRPPSSRSAARRCLRARVARDESERGLL